jgi:hypothetical protein
MGRQHNEAQERSNNDVVRAPRNSTLLKAKCKRANGAEYEITLRNASATGLLGNYREAVNFVVGEAVSLILRNLNPISAQVVWCEGGQVGFNFASTVDVERLLRNHAQAALPRHSPRSENMQDWIARARRERELASAQRGAAGARPV